MRLINRYYEINNRLIYYRIRLIVGPWILTFSDDNGDLQKRKLGKEDDLRTLRFKDKAQALSGSSRICLNKDTI